MMWSFLLFGCPPAPSPPETVVDTSPPRPGPEQTFEDCADGVDNNDNGLVDCEDAECLRASNCYEADCLDGVDGDDDGLLDCEDADCWTRSGCAPEREVSVDSGDIWRRHITKNVLFPGTIYRTHYVTFYALSGVVRAPQAPAMYLSTASAFDSCMFALRDWRVHVVLSEATRELVEVTASSPAALSFAPGCDRLPPAAFLPAHQGDPGWELLVGRRLFRSSQGVLGEASGVWFTGSSLTRSEITTNYSGSTMHGHIWKESTFLRRSFRGDIQGKSPFIWRPEP